MFGENGERNEADPGEKKTLVRFASQLEGSEDGTPKTAVSEDFMPGNNVEYGGESGGESSNHEIIPATKARSESIYNSPDMSSNDLNEETSAHKALTDEIPPPPPLYTDSSDDEEGAATPIKARGASIDMSAASLEGPLNQLIDESGQKKVHSEEDPLVLRSSPSQLTEGDLLKEVAVDQTQLLQELPLPNSAVATFLQKITAGAQHLLLTANGEVKAPSEESVLLDNSAKINEDPKELLSDHLLYGGAIVGFVSGPAIRCLNDYVSGNKDKTCADHYYATFSATNLLHIASSYITSSVLHAVSVSSFDKNDYFCKKYPFALGLAYTAGYDVLDLSVSLVKSGYNLLAGNSEDSGSDL